MVVPTEKVLGDAAIRFAWLCVTTPFFVALCSKICVRRFDYDFSVLSTSAKWGQEKPQPSLLGVSVVSSPSAPY